MLKHLGAAINRVLVGARVPIFIPTFKKKTQTWIETHIGINYNDHTHIQWILVA